MSNAVYELCPVTGRVLDKNRLLYLDEIRENFNAIGSEGTSFGLVARIARTVFRNVNRPTPDSISFEFPVCPIFSTESSTRRVVVKIAPSFSFLFTFIIVF